ncbi:hypothetical protein NCC49_006387 [Naganishia albida]|nr:hypothetical protein NCC49_006387 [Naganishia albida]
MSLLIITAPTVAPAPFIHSLTQGTDTVWTIDNKYYSARVDVVVRGVEDVGQVDTVEAVIYLYDNDATPPERLTSLVQTVQPELSFAIRLPPPPFPSPADDERQSFDPESEQDAWDAVGVEYVDLSSSDEDKLRDVRDSLQTIMWPGMVRKPLARKAVKPAPSHPSSRKELPLAPPPSRKEEERTPFDLSPAEEEAFLQHEQHKLDAWLDEDEIAFPTLAPRDNPAHTVAAAAAVFGGGGFDDDFSPPSPHGPSNGGDEFTGFQSASALLEPAPIPTETTDLFAHLDALRTELAGVPDEERRVRAAREVERLFVRFGVGLDLDDESDGLPSEEEEEEVAGAGEVKLAR